MLFYHLSVIQLLRHQSRLEQISILFQLNVFLFLAMLFYSYDQLLFLPIYYQ
nr:MAG TPA: hypothetical protein [Caudoviricetes sp.]